MSWKKVKLKQILKQYRIEHLVQNDIEYKQVTISKYDGVTFRGTKMGKEIGRKRQFKIDLKKYPNTLMFVRQGVQDGSIGIAPLEVDGCIATENMPMFSIEGINLEYLKFLLKSPYFYDELNKIELSGSAQKSIHEKTFLNLQFFLPPFELQKEIVVELLKLKRSSDEISTELTHQLTLVKKLRQQLLQDAVQGKLMEQNPKDEPASELLKKIKAEKEKLIAEKKLKKEKELLPIKPEEIPFEIPENWVWCRLGEIIYDTEGGKSPNCLHEPAKDNEWGVIKTTAVQEMYFLENENKVLPNNFIVSEQHKVLEGDILITRAGPKNRVGIVCCVENLTKNLILSDKTIRIKHSKKLLLSKFIALALNSPLIKPFIEQKMTGMADSQVNISQDNMKGFQIPLPPLTEQIRIVQKVDELMQYCNDLEASIKQSESQNEKLLQQVLREALRKEPVGV